jgi:hypothetical protein
MLAGMRRVEGPVAVRDPGETDTEELLREAGLAASDIEKLRGEGVIA